MKRWFGIFAVTALLPTWLDAAAAGTAPHEPESSSAHQGRGGGAIQRFVDEDGDGLNDLVSDSDGDGIPNESGYGYDHSDATHPSHGTAGMPASGSGMGGGNSRSAGR
jgi:hypothetical protein